jgi:UDP-N-acetylglucosamine 2-epimerase (non-hydrolysing)
MEAGNRSFENNVPEELNRKMVDHVARFNLPYNDYSMRDLLAEGIHPRFIQKTGSPIREIYEHYQDKIASSAAVRNLGLTARGYFLVSSHRQDNVDLPESLEKVLDYLVAVREKWDIPRFVSSHPRNKVRLEAITRKDIKGTTFLEPFGYLDYNKLWLEAKFVISDSGTISERSSITDFRAVSLRGSIERPETLKSGSIILPSIEPAAVVRAIEISEYDVPEGYEIHDFSTRVLKFLKSTAGKHGAREASGLEQSLLCPTKA